MEISKLTIEEAIEQLDRGIKQLRIEYERYFAGTIDRTPTLVQYQVEAIIRYYRNNPPKGFSHRFQMNTLISRFNMLRELWGRNLRMREMGLTRPHLRLTARAANKPAPTPPGGNGVPRNGNDSAADAPADALPVEALYREFADLHLRHRGAPTQVTLEVFADRVRRCAEDVRQKSGCTAVDFRLTVDDNRNIRLKARPLR